MGEKTQLPICLSGAYAPFVLGCGSFPVNNNVHLLSFSPSGADISTLRYRFLRVERASLRLGGRQGPLVSTGGVILLPPGITVQLHLAKGLALSHLIFEVVGSQHGCSSSSGCLVAVDSVQQPSPMEVWGVNLPMIVPPELIPLIHAQWLHIRDRYWRSLQGQLEANHALAGFLLAMIPNSAESDISLSGPEEKEPDPIRRAINFGIRTACLAPPPRSRDLARIAGLSPGQFRRKLLETEGVSPCQWLLKLRLEAAAVRLMAGVTAHQAALTGGWKSPANFNRAFAKQYGCSPGAWKKKNIVLKKK